MEVTKRGLGFLTVVAVATVLAGSALQRRPTNLPNPREASSERVAVRALQDSVYRLAQLVRTGAARDRVDSAFRTYPAGQVPQLVVIGGGRAAAMAEAARMLLDSLPFPPRPEVPVRLVLLQAPEDSSSTIGLLTRFTILPSTDSQVGCTSVRVVFPGEVADSEERWGWQRRGWVGTLGPCWYLASFGQPGAAVRAWLDSRYWDVARWIPPQPELVRISDDAFGASNVWLNMLGEIPDLFSGGSAILGRCATTSPELCEVALLNTPFAQGRLPAGVVESEFGPVRDREPFDWLTGVPRWATEGLLAAMVEDLGPARFRAFWTSSAPVAEAFEAAAGTPLGEWFGERLRRGLRRAGVPDQGRGPHWPSVVGVLGLALGASVWGARRRQVR